MHLNDIVLISSVTLLISVLLSKSSNKFGLPILILFMGIGMVAGSESLGGISYENYELTHSLSLIAICLVIFSGGIMTKAEDIKPIIKQGVSLSVIGVLCTTAFTGAFCYLFLDLPVFGSLLIGAILSSTDAAAVFTAFRDKNAQVSKKIKSLLEFESGSNDPMTYLLVVVFLGYYQTGTQPYNDLIYTLLVNPFVGTIGGFLTFKIFQLTNDKIKLDFQGLYPALTTGFLFLTYSLTSKFDGNGFLAVYIFAVKLGNAKVVHKNALINFFDGISWLSQIGLFIMLGILVKPERLLEIAPAAIIVALFLIFVGRPTSVLISLARTDYNLKSKLFVAWGGLKGATPIVFASLVATEVGTGSHLIFDIVFFTVLTSALMQGSTLRIVAKKCNLLYEAIIDPEFPIDQEVIDNTKNGIRELHITEDFFAVEKRIVDLNLPSGTLILFIKRKGSFIIPHGPTQIEINDKVLIVTPEKSQIDNAVDLFVKGDLTQFEESLEILKAA